MTADAATQPTVRFLFDPMCPWTWRTSKWMREIQIQEGLEVDWRLYSLEYVNRAQTDNTFLPILQAARPALRLLELVRRQSGPGAVSRLYVELGTARHENDADLGDEDVLRGAAERAGVDASLVDEALRNTALDGELEAQYQAYEAQKVIGVPTLFIGDAVPVYGPVLDPAPSGEDAHGLWEDVRQLSQRPFFYELKRSR